MESVEAVNVKTWTLIILSNIASLMLGVLVQQTLLTVDVAKRLMGPLLETSAGSLFPLAYFALPLVILAVCLYCGLSHFRYERRRWKLIVGMSAPGLIACSLIFPFNLFLCCALVT